MTPVATKRIAREQPHQGRENELLVQSPRTKRSQVFQLLGRRKGLQHFLDALVAEDFVGGRVPVKFIFAAAGEIEPIREQRVEVARRAAATDRSTMKRDRRTSGKGRGGYLFNFSAGIGLQSIPPRRVIDLPASARA